MVHHYPSNKAKAEAIGNPLPFIFGHQNPIIKLKGKGHKIMRNHKHIFNIPIFKNPQIPDINLISRIIAIFPKKDLTKILLIRINSSNKRNSFQLILRSKIDKS
jgi:hypothetical protein